MTALRRNQLQHFDSWAGTFGETVTAMELSPDGNGYRLQSRFARFVNVPELMQQYRQVADVQTAEMPKLPIPKLEQGRPLTVSAPTSPELKRFVEQLVKRTEQIKNGSVDPRDDNMLKITTEGRKAALDLRLMLPHVRDNPDSKTNQAVEKIHRVWLESTPQRGRTKAGRALVFLAAALKPFQSTNTIGSIGGFPLSLHKFDERVNLTIHGKNTYNANVSDSALGTIASIEHALEGMEDRLHEREADLKQAGKQSEDLAKQLDHPFEHEQKLSDATKRQQEIVTALDITKNQASAKIDEVAEQAPEIIEEKQRQSIRTGCNAAAAINV